MRNDSTYEGVFAVVKGLLLALACSLFFTVIFACVLRYGGLSSKVVYPVNQGIKVVSIALGALVFIRGEKGWLKGLGVGLLFTALSYLVFSAIGGDFSLSWLIFVEVALGAFSGALCGVIAVNLRR